MVQRLIRRTQRSKRREQRKEALQAPLLTPPSPVLHAHEAFYSDYYEDWIDVTEEASHDYLLPTHVINVAPRSTYAPAEASGLVLQNGPNNIKQAVLAIRDLSTDLHEHSCTFHGIRDLVLAQNPDVHVFSLKKLLVNNENIDHHIFPEDVRSFAHNYFKQ